MNAGKRWAYHFISGLECVNCRKGHGLKLFSHDGTEINSNELNPWDFRVEEMDVWCSTCPVVITKKVKSLGRLKHKQQAAQMANVRSRAQRASLYDVYHIYGRDLTRIQLDAIMKKLKTSPADENFLESVCRFIKE